MEGLRGVTSILFLAQIPGIICAAGGHTRGGASIGRKKRGKGRMGRNPCCSEEGLNRGTWMAEEDEILARYVRVHGEGNWRSLPKRAGEDISTLLSISGLPGNSLRCACNPRH